MPNKRITKISQLPWVPRGLVLDPYAGSRCWWAGTAADVVFTDKFFILPGTIRADASNLPFDNGVFDEVWADPPHWIRKSPPKRTCNFVNATATAWSRHADNRAHGYFGAYPTRDALRTEWKAVALELHRVTKPGAFLTWKSIYGAKTVAQCCSADDLMDCLSPRWEFVDFRAFPSCVSWSNADTLWSRWKRLDAETESISTH